ncbi:alpha/beta hydrolase [Bradyrhizobium sp. Arg237L]|uniref:alpha/beta fold hydrolase n=1 Tax=Bradyrhizobium sp. Arg237L TaxID=3003352 RepID=UPI00249E67EE|nr:alpha/beta hydrolase [Bradyrhizobium sp. Arg237L]MDI4237110.1 alpha/beta hydrolase [Bradyrhizobium sp. Arg237L]
MQMIGNLACTVEGSGPPLIFVTGLGGRADYWHLQVKHLADRFTCITYDHPGIGQSPSVPTPYSVAGWAADVLGIADALCGGGFSLVGHSTGGAIAQYIAAHTPDRVSRLCLTGTWAYADMRFRTVFALRRNMLAAGDAEGYGVLGTILTKPLVWPESKPPGGRSDSDAEVTLGRIDALLAHDSRSYLDKIVAPTLVCSALDDLLVPGNHGRQLADAIASAELKLFDRGGHHFPQTQSVAFNAALSTFLDR